jgi:hypothetical protein
MPAGTPPIGQQIVDAGTSAAAVTKSDTTELGPTRALYIGGAGNVAVMMQGDDAAVTFTAVPVGTILPISVRRVMSTDTTATNIVAIY